jgi:hypothetical protein
LWLGEEDQSLGVGEFVATVRTLFLVFITVAVCGCLDAPVEQSPRQSAAAPPDNSNGKPSIQGIPANSIRIGEPFKFRPKASDPDNDPLTFSIKNKPNWADFDPKTGTISGTPLLGHEGKYNNIRITVSDGKDSAGMSFGLDVTAIGSASVTLSWTPPTEYEDGSPLTDLDGYYIYYGDEKGDYPNVIHIENESISTYVVGNLSEKTYYFVATSYNSQGVESRRSNVAKKEATP